MLQDTRYLETSRSWTNVEAREALRVPLAEQARALDAEIKDLVRQGRRGIVDLSPLRGVGSLCVRLARMRDDELWKHLGDHASFADYAVKVGAAESHTAAKDMAGLAQQLRSLPLLHAVFEAGKADWTKVKEAAPAALAKPEDEARWAEEVQVSSFNEVRAKAQVALGKTPTRNMTLSLPRDVHALWEHTRRVTGERTGVVLTQGEFVDLLLDAATRAGLTNGRAQEANDDEADGEGSAAPARIPPPTAVLHAHVCRLCDAVEVEGPDGPATLAPERAEVLAEDVWVQDAEGNLTRAIPERVRRQVYARDRGCCRVPGCGALGSIHVHHVGEGGWKKTGHEADGLLLLCALHHRRHHDGWFSIHGGHSAGFRFFDADGNELLGPRASSWWPTPPSTAAPPARREAERMAAGTPEHPDDVTQDVRAALRTLQFKAEEAKALLAHVLPLMPADATASQIVTAVLQAKR